APYLLDAQPRPGWMKALARPVAALAPALPVAKLDAARLSRDPRVGEAYLADPLVYSGPVKAATGHALTAAGPELLARAAALAAPTLVLHGEADGVAAVEGSRRLAAAASAGTLELVTFPGAYHELHNEPEETGVPERFVAAVLAFVRGGPDLGAGRTRGQADARRAGPNPTAGPTRPAPGPTGPRSSRRRQRAREPVQGLVEDPLARREVEAHEALAAGAELGALVQAHLRDVGETLGRPRAQTGPAQVEPRQVRGLRHVHAGPRELRAHEAHDLVAVAAQVVEGRRQPVVAVTVGGERGGLGQAAGPRVQAARRAGQALQHRRTAGEGEADAEAREVERLRGAVEGQRPRRDLGRERGERDVLAPVGDVGVELVGDDREVVLERQLGQGLELGARVHAADRVVGVAQHQQARALGHGGPDGVHVQLVALLAPDELDLDGHPLRLHDRALEGWVEGREEHD